MVAMTTYGLKELLMHVPDPTGYQAFVGLLRNLKTMSVHEAPPQRKVFLA